MPTCAPANVLTGDGTFCGVIDFGDLCAGDPAYDLAAGWLLLPDGATDHFYAVYQPTPDTVTMRRARGWAMARALGGILIGDAGEAPTLADRGSPAIVACATCHAGRTWPSAQRCRAAT